jgi:hypothetical protein
MQNTLELAIIQKKPSTLTKKDAVEELADFISTNHSTKADKLLDQRERGATRFKKTQVGGPYQHHLFTRLTHLTFYL